MAAQAKSSNMAIIVMGLLLVLSPNMFSSATASSGTATFYEPRHSSSACEGKSHVEGVMIAAVSNDMWDGGKACGKELTVKCTGKANNGPRACKGGDPITVKIGDFCKACSGNHIDLTKDAFSKIAFLDAGVVKISFHQV